MMDKERFLNETYKKLIEQFDEGIVAARRREDDNGFACVYAAEPHGGCAIGCWIPDEEKQYEWDDNLVDSHGGTSVVSAKLRPAVDKYIGSRFGELDTDANDMLFLSDVQSSHDTAAKEHMLGISEFDDTLRKGFSDIADQYQLVFNPS